MVIACVIGVQTKGISENYRPKKNPQQNSKPFDAVKPAHLLMLSYLKIIELGDLEYRHSIRVREPKKLAGIDNYKKD